MSFDAATILVADANGNDLGHFQHALVDLGYFVDTANDGVAALEYLKGNTPNVIILAADMGDPSGFEVCYRLKHVRRLQRIPVLLMASNQDQHEHAELVHADAILTKPFPFEVFRSTVAELVKRNNAPAYVADPKGTMVLEFDP